LEIVFWGVTAALAALGLIELVRMLVFWLTRPLRPGALADEALLMFQEVLRRPPLRCPRIGQAPMDGLGPLPLGVRQ